MNNPQMETVEQRSQYFKSLIENSLSAPIPELQKLELQIALSTAYFDGVNHGIKSMADGLSTSKAKSEILETVEI